MPLGTAFTSHVEGWGLNTVPARDPSASLLLAPSGTKRSGADARDWCFRAAGWDSGCCRGRSGHWRPWNSPVLDDAYLNWITLRTNAYTISAWPIEEEEGMAILAQLPAAVLVVEVFTHLEPVPIIYAWCRIFSTRIWEAWKATFTSSLSA